MHSPSSFEADNEKKINMYILGINEKICFGWEDRKWGWLKMFVVCSLVKHHDGILTFLSTRTPSCLKINTFSLRLMRLFRRLITLLSAESSEEGQSDNIRIVFASTHVCWTKMMFFELAKRRDHYFFNSGQITDSGDMCTQIKSIYFLVPLPEKWVKTA